MATHCRIGIKNEDGSVTSIYCHNDGDPNGPVGYALKMYYDTDEKVRKLLELGDLSALGEEPIEDPEGWDKFCLKEAPLPPDMCTTYKSRGDNRPAMHHESVDAYIKDAAVDSCDYAYLRDDGRWFFERPCL